jgi:hypothetical protein
MYRDVTHTSETPETPAAESERLRRHIRALSAVNRELHAQLPDSSWTANRVRRGSLGHLWCTELQQMQTTERPELVQGPGSGLQLIEGGVRRPVVSHVLAAALAAAFGPVRAVTEEAIDGYAEGPPVAVLEGSIGRPFVIVGGTRFTLRGLPLPHPVTDDDMLAFPAGDELVVGAGLRSGTTRFERMRLLFSDAGPVAATQALARKAGRRLRRRRPPR